MKFSVPGRLRDTLRQFVDVMRERFRLKDRTKNPYHASSISTFHEMLCSLTYHFWHTHPTISA